MVETRCCASTSRHQRPEISRLSERSASGVQVCKDIEQSGNGCEFVGWRSGQSGIVVFQPAARNGFVPADNSIQRAKDANEQHRKLKRFAGWIENEIELLHAGNSWCRDAQNVCDTRGTQTQPISCGNDGFRHNPALLCGRCLCFHADIHGISFPWKEYSRFLSENKKGWQ